jgi:hypothetical protein
LDELEQLGIDGGPDRGGGLATGQRRERIAGGAVVRGVAAGAGGFAHGLDGNLDAQVELLLGSCVEDRDLAVRSDEKAADLLEWVLGGAQADALHARSASARRSWLVGCPRHVNTSAVCLRVEPLEREREVRAALGVRDCVDLIDDHRVYRVEHVACA